MTPIEPDGEDLPAEHLGFEIDEAFRRLARAEHAPEGFHAQVMARAADLPLPRQHRLTVKPWQDLDLHLRLPRAATVVLATVLLLCMAGLGYLYHRVGQMQTIVEQTQERKKQQALEVARLPQERTELSEITLEVDLLDAKDDDPTLADKALGGQEPPSASGIKSMLDHVVDALQRAFGTLWNKVKGVEQQQQSSP